MEHLPAEHGYILDDYSAMYFHVRIIKIKSVHKRWNLGLLSFIIVNKVMSGSDLAD